MKPGARRRYGRPVPLGSVLGEIYPDRASWPTIRAMQAWVRGLPRRVVMNARPVRVSRGVMWVHVTSPIWSQELSLLAPELLARIRREPGAAKVTELRFRVGELPEVPPGLLLTAPEPEEAPPPLEDPELLAAVDAIPDDRLRALLLRTIPASLRRTESLNARRTPRRAPPK